jgi:two-component system nitrogen regulation sensor histidine kinase NtrY
MSGTKIPEAEHRRRRREFIIILIVIPAIILLTYLESNLSIISPDIPIPTNILLLGLININIILLALLIFLVLRNFVKFFFERRSKVMGSKLMTKLVMAFVGLTIIPTFILFFVVIGFINKSIDGWFAIKIEDSLSESLELAQSYYQDMTDRVMSGARTLSFTVARRELMETGDELRAFVHVRLEENDYSTIEIYSPDGVKISYSIATAVNKNMVPDIDFEHVEKALEGEASSFIQTLVVGDVVRGVYPVRPIDNTEIISGAVVVSHYVPRSLIAKMKEISTAFEGYKQLKLLRNPVKASYFSILLIITLLIVFFAIWVGRYLAKGLTVPIYELAEGTHAVASGNLDYKIEGESNDEIGLLVKSFNRMTEDLKASKSRLEEANLDLRQTNIELEQRRRYIEIVLGNVSAGVISIDKLGRITALNRVASDILGTDAKNSIERNYKDVLRAEDREVFRELIREMTEIGSETLERQMKVDVQGTPVTVLVNLNALRDEHGSYIGMVAVLDDITHMLKTQRMFAWKEVARRIAHEIKNPLTPIKLSAQRLRKKYLKKFDDSSGVFDDCTETIIKQVDELKFLVNEFSSFARMPASNPTPNDLNAIVEETVAFYKPGHKEIVFEVEVDPTLPVFNIDRDQIKRVLINLIDNSVASISSGGIIRVVTEYVKDVEIAKLEVIDNGSGIEPGDRERLFEPYFSTKGSGTGLGLAIVNNIVSDHSGYIRVKENRPKGTRFIVELPIKTVSI